MRVGPGLRSAPPDFVPRGLQFQERPRGAQHEHARPSSIAFSVPGSSGSVSTVPVKQNLCNHRLCLAFLQGGSGRQVRQSSCLQLVLRKISLCVAHISDGSFATDPNSDSADQIPLCPRLRPNSGGRCTSQKATSQKGNMQTFPNVRFHGRSPSRAVCDALPQRLT
jgi:hypothetical protein